MTSVLIERPPPSTHSLSVCSPPPLDLAQGESTAGEAELVALKKRRLLVVEAWKTYRVVKGPRWAPARTRAATDLTADMLQK